MSSGAPKKILVVDNDRQTANLVKVKLEEAGYAVVVAKDGLEALEQVGLEKPDEKPAEKPDMIILELTIPRMNGFDVLKRLQASPDTEDIPVIMLTAKADAEEEAWRLGVSSFLTKSFNPRELLTFVQRIFESLEPS